MKRLFSRNVAAECHHWGRAEQADIDAVHAKSRALSGNRHIARRDKLATCGCGNAVDLRNDRLWQTKDRLHHCGATTEKIGKIGRTAVFGLPTRGHLLEVMAGAKGFAFAF